MVQVEPERTLAVLVILPGVQDRLMPGDVHDLRWAKAAVGVVGDEVHVGEGVVECRRCHLLRHPVLALQAVDELAAVVRVQLDDVLVHWWLLSWVVGYQLRKSIHHSI